eukprot:11452412-Karenia_brevis.AAC.1
MVQALYEKLNRAYDDVMIGLTSGGFSPAFWDSDPMVVTLYKALFGNFGGLGNVHTIPQFTWQCF